MRSLVKSAEVLNSLNTQYFVQMKDGKERAIDDWHCMLIGIREYQMQTNVEKTQTTLYIPASQLTVDLQRNIVINMQGYEKEFVRSTQDDRYQRIRPEFGYKNSGFD